MEYLEKMIRSNIYKNEEDPFFVFIVEDILRKHQKWLEQFPRVVPHYAVKCNNNPLVLEILSGLELSFDCSSQLEVEEVLRCGIDPKNIIFANACKSNSFIRFVRSVGLDVMTFDNEEELIKISVIFPEARLVLRIKADDSHSTSKLSLKFGAEVENFEHLLKKAKNLGLNVIGIAFHVGSGCQSTDPYTDAIKKARHAFDLGKELGFKMTLLDIGGGFPGNDRNSKLSFEVISRSVNKDLDKYFPQNGNELTIIAEPGRYYAMSAFDLITLVTSKRTDSWNNQKLCMYYINDGLYGSFSSVVTGNKVVEPIPLLRNQEELESRESCLTVIWGPTCDSYDCIRRDFKMPELFVGEWIRFENMGSYSLTASSHFNGMALPHIKIFVSEYSKSILVKMKNWSKIEKLIDSYDHLDTFNNNRITLVTQETK